MSNIGPNNALVTILGTRLGIGANNPLAATGVGTGGPGTASLILDGWNIASPPGGAATVTSAKGAITALAGGGASSLTPIAYANYNRITTVATTSDSVQLPLSQPGMEISICQESSLSGALFPYYNSTDIINALTTGVSLAIGSSRIINAMCVTTGFWRVVVLPSSIA